MLSISLDRIQYKRRMCESVLRPRNPKINNTVANKFVKYLNFLLHVYSVHFVYSIYSFIEKYMCCYIKCLFPLLIMCNTRNNLYLVLRFINISIFIRYLKFGLYAQVYYVYYILLI